MESFVSLFYPKQCYGCQRYGSCICKLCFLNYCVMPYKQICHVCERECKYGLIHTDCKNKTYLDGLLYVTIYTPIIQDIVSDGKYHSVEENFKDLAIIMSDLFLNYFTINIEVVTSVPMFIFKRKKRGYNQAFVLAKEFSKLSSLKYKDLLFKQRDTYSQVGMGREERIANLANIFKIHPSASKNFNSVLIMDDVFTTGTTLEQCAKTLKENGVKQVYGYTFAKAGNR